MGITAGMIYLAGMVVQVLGLLLHIAGLATPEWSSADFPTLPYIGEDSNDYLLDYLEIISDDSVKSYFNDHIDDDVRDFAKFYTRGENIRVKASLWECCSEGSLGRYCLSVSECEALMELIYIGLDAAAYRAAEAFAIIGGIAQMIAIGSGLVFVLFPKFGKTCDARLVLFSVGLAGAASFCVLLCAIIYGAAVHQKTFKDINAGIGYSFALSITGGFLTAIGGGLVFLGRTQTTPSDACTST